MRKILVWDLPTRLFHWLLVAAMAGAWISAEKEAFDWHMRFGYAVLALVVFRLVWGVVGSDTARFTRFVRGPAAILAYWHELRATDRMAAHAGHNPLGALSVLALLGFVAAQAVSGLFTSDGILVDGPLVAHVGGGVATLMRSVHLNNFNILLALVGLHVAAILAYALFRRLDLVRPMVTGRAMISGNNPPPRIVSLVRAVPVAAISVLLIWALVRFA